MLRTPRRFISTATSAATKRLVDGFRKKTIRTPPIVRKQFLDSNQIQHFSLALNRPQLYGDLNVHGIPPVGGTPIPPGYHLVYFTPAALPEELGSDGTDSSYSPGPPFTRRMWAGGEIKWEKGNPLRVGDEAVETTRLVSAEDKITRTGEEMIVVGVEKTFENGRGPALIEKRDLVFRTQLAGPAPLLDSSISANINSGNLPQADKSEKVRDFLQTAVSLFRFSALTFNGHMIHYSRSWCREVEGHRDLVVHGPLNLVNMLDFWRDTHKSDYLVPQSLSYRATAPFYVGEKYRALLERTTGTTSIKIWGRDGRGDVRVGMLGNFVD